MSMVSQGNIDVLPNTPFRIIVENISKKPIHLKSRIYVGKGFNASIIIVSFSKYQEHSVNSLFL